MDTIYSNKKYLQNLSAADYYRTGTMRPQTNEYASYHNTMSRRSLFGSHYSHQPNISKYKYSYPSDVSLSSHYGYTSWGLWRDTGHLSPSVYSKKRINIRSFSILIMSAAFIVLLAVLSVAGLAFYFSTFKSDSTESMLVFDCTFRIAKGDIWVSQLKYNQTPVFRQKSAFYTKFIETSLEHGNFNVAKTDINSFGNGPDIQLSFRIYLDMRKIQMTITNVEEHIKNTFISETGNSDSTYRNMKIDIDTIEIKRQLDPEILQKAAFIYEQSSQDILTTLMPTTVIPLDDLQMSTKKLSGMAGVEKPKVKTSSTQTPMTSSKVGSKLKITPKPIQESDIDTENLPVIQGSFEITKTDADISQKRSSNSRPGSTISLTPSTLKPFYISPASSIKIKSSGQQQHSTSSSTTSKSTTIKTATKISSSAESTTAKTDNIVEMFLQHQKNLQKQHKIKESPVTAKIEKTNKSGETIKTTEMMTESSMATSTLQMTTNAPHDYIRDGNFESQINNKDLPKLDVSLFTSAPVLDNEPWRPINPSAEQVKTHLPTAVHTSESSSSTLTLLSTEMPPYRSPFNPKPNENVIYRNKFVDPDAIYPVKETDSDAVLYQSYYNPDFSAGSLEIEKLGMADVRPYPLPVNKIDISEEVNNPETSQMELMNDNKKLMIDTSNVNYDENKFEHLGGGVIAKKHDNSSNSSGNNTMENNTAATDVMQSNMNATNDAAEDDVKTKNDTDTDTSFDDIFQELLDNNVTLNKTQDDVLESRIVSDDDEENDDDDDDDETYDEVSSSSLLDENGNFLTTTPKLNFLNMKNFIMQMKQNKSSELLMEGVETATTLKSPLSTVTFDIATAVNDGGLTTLKPTTTFVEVNTVRYTPLPSVKTTSSSSGISTTTNIPEPQLFPSISKWEFVNGTRTNISEPSLTKKVFNKTLQAVIVENSQTASHVTHLDDFKANQTRDKGNLQQLSSIFDTLAAKLGIKPDVASKVPPFSQHTQNKIKLNANNSHHHLRTTTLTSARKNLGSTTKQYVTRTTTKTSKKSPVTTTATAAITTTRRPTTIEPTRSFELSSETMIGQAEVEAVDPTQYEEILSLASSPISRKFISTTPSLVTLLPVKSNSGIRNFNPRLKLPSNIQTSSETRNMETVVKASMSFDS